ncbi:hypothetical protein LCGC14_0547500 [marine sediment metagenome]|uniref:Uncharacterized protein n=1 Tax=marine sediment metagenome TaxID=412755 RepID=A0A0F9UZ18_9ZZZZ
MSNINYDKIECKSSHVKELAELSRSPEKCTNPLQKQLIEKINKQQKEINKLKASNVEIVDDLLTNLCDDHE